MPAGSLLMLDVSRLDRIAPQVFGAASTAQIAGALGPLLARLGRALAAEGVNVASLISIFDHETAVAIVPGRAAPTLLIVARAPDQAAVQTELAQVQIPLAQLFQAPASGAGSVPEFNDRQIGAVTAHQLVLASGLELDYAVFNGLVAISTSLSGLAAVVTPTQTLAGNPSFQFTLNRRPKLVSSIVYLDLGRLLALGEQTGLISSARLCHAAPGPAEDRRDRPQLDARCGAGHGAAVDPDPLRLAGRVGASRGRGGRGRVGGEGGAGTEPSPQKRIKSTPIL